MAGSHTDATTLYYDHIAGSLAGVAAVTLAQVGPDAAPGFDVNRFTHPSDLGQAHAVMDILGLAPIERLEILQGEWQHACGVLRSNWQSVRDLSEKLMVRALIPYRLEKDFTATIEGEELVGLLGRPKLPATRYDVNGVKG